MQPIFRNAVAIAWMAAFCAGCAGAAAPTVLPTPLITSTVQPSPTATEVPATPTETGTPTETPIPTMPADLPPLEMFRTSRLLQGVTPAAYLADTCRYLGDRWSAERSAPGTVVIPVMWHSVNPNGNAAAGDAPTEDFNNTVYWANQWGYKLITMPEFVAFLETNAKIPPRSMVWIVDDRRPGVVSEVFLPMVRQYGGKVSNAWPIGDTDQRAGLWGEIEAIHSTGLVEMQAHGFVHNIPITDYSTEEFLRHEIIDPIAVFEQHFGVRPTAFVWPGGGFSKAGAAMLREAGYKLAFTAFARGPVMYNWVPLGDAERAIGDPVMVLPRQWGFPGLVNQLKIDAIIGEAAAQAARDAYPAEADYYRANCGGELPALPPQEPPLPPVG